MLSKASKDTNRLLIKNEEIILKIIEQNQPTSLENTQDALIKAETTLNEQIQLLDRLYAPSEGNVCFVPDTNALLYNPDLDKWRFKDVSRFDIILIPVVLSELDLLKVNHKNENVRKNMENLYAKLKNIVDEEAYLKE